MAMPLARHFEFCGDWTHGQSWFRVAIERLEEAEPGARALGPALTVLHMADALLRYRLGDLSGAELHARKAHTLARRLKDARGVKGSLNTMGLALWKQGRQRQAGAAFAKVVQLAERDGDRKALASASNGVALTEKALGHYDAAQLHYERALALNRELGDAFGVVSALNNLGNLMRALDQWAKAKPLFEQAVSWCDEHNLASLRPYPTVNLGLTAFELGDLDAAERWMREASTQLMVRPEPYLLVTVPLALARIATARGDLDAAPALLAEAMQLARRMGHQWTMLNIVVGWAEWAARSGQTQRAAAMLLFVAQHAQVEAANRDEARHLLAGMVLTRAERSAAVRQARGFELQALVAALDSPEQDEQR
jgi:tetratricopeptide (TPR) repeat protein